MNAVVWVAVGAPAALLVGIALSYNRFVRQRNHVTESWSNVDTELRRRYDLIPNLVATVKGYAAHERALLEQVTAARAAAVAATGAPSSQAPVENELVRGVRGLLALVEGYPDLKASEQFLELQRELVDTEDRIQAARRFYNANVRDLNRRVQSFPSMLIARWFGFTEADFFEIEEAIRRGPAPDAAF